MRARRFGRLRPCSHPRYTSSSVAPMASAFGWPAAVLLAALAHAAYKTALFAWPPNSQTAVFDLVGIGLWTGAAGIVLGLLRVSSRSLLPAVLGHVAFDAVVYSSYAQAPWWVWS